MLVIVTSYIYNAWKNLQRLKRKEGKKESNAFLIFDLKKHKGDKNMCHDKFNRFHKFGETITKWSTICDATFKKWVKDYTNQTLEP